MTTDSAREAAEKWLAEAFKLQFCGPFEVFTTLDDVIGQCARIAADFAERFLAEYRDDLTCTFESWASERSHAASNESDSEEKACFLGSKEAHRTDASYVRRAPLPWAAATKEGGE